MSTMHPEKPTVLLYCASRFNFWDLDGTPHSEHPSVFEVTPLHAGTLTFFFVS